MKGMRKTPSHSDSPYSYAPRVVVPQSFVIGMEQDEGVISWWVQADFV